MSAPIRLDFAASTAKARAEINALSTTIDKLQGKLLAASGMNLMDGKATPLIGKHAQAITQQAAVLESLGGRTVDLATPVKQTEELVKNINKGKISMDEFRRASGKSSRVVTQQLALQRATITGLEMDSKQNLTGQFRYGDVTKGIAPLERLAMQARVTGAALQGLGQHYVDMGKNMAFSARQLTISLTMPFAVVSAVSMKAYMDTAESLTDIAKLYGDSADGFSRSTDQIKAEARELARSMSDTYAAAYQDTYDHQKFYASQGLTGADLSGSTQQAIRLQMLGDVDTETAQQAITTLTNVYGVQVEQMGLYVDYMNKIEDSTTLTMQDFSEAMPKIGPIIKSFTDDPKEATKAMAEMLEAGKRGGIQSATEIANAWKSIYTKVARPTEQLKNTWSELGSKNGLAQSFMGIVTEKGGDVMEIVKEISTLTQDWSDTDKGRLFSQLAGAQQVARMSTFAQQLANSSDTIKEINAEFDNNPQALSDNSRRQEDEIMASPEKRWAQFMNRLKDTGVTIGETVFKPIMTILEGAAGFVETIVDGFSKLPKPLQVAAGILGGFAVTLGPIIGVLGALIQVGGVLRMIHGTGLKAIGNVATKALTGVKSKQLLTPDDKIRELSEDENFQLKHATAYRDMLLQMQASTNDVSSSFTALEAQVRKTTQAMVNGGSAATANAGATAAGRGNLRPQDIERRQGILRAGALGSTGERLPQREQVYVPPKPAKGRRGHDSLEMQQYKQAVARNQESKRVHDLEMDAFRQRQADARRVAARYKSFTDYMKNTPQERLDANYNASKVSPERAAQMQKRHLNRRLMGTEGMQRIAATANQGTPVVSGAIGTATSSRTQFSALDGQTVRDQVGYVNRDLAHAKNTLGNKNAVQRVAQEKEIARLMGEQVRLNRVLKGSTSEIAREAEKIKQSYSAQSVGKTSLLKPRGIVPSMRSGGDQIMHPDATDPLTDAPIIGGRTGRTKSGTYQASDKFSRKAMRRMTPADRQELERVRDSSNPYVEAKLSTGTVNMTPEHWKMADAQITKVQKSQEKLERTHEKINRNSEKYVSTLSSAVTGAGALVMMFGGDNQIAQWFGGLTTAFGISMSMMPKTAEKAFKSIATFGTTAFSQMGNAIGGIFSSKATGFAADMVGNMKSKFLGLSGWMKANAGMLMGWGAAFVAVAAAGAIAYRKLSEDSKKYREELERDIGKAKELADLLGFHYINPIQFQNQGSSITDNERELASQMAEMESMQGTIDSLRGKRISSINDIHDMRVALTPDAIKILASGGTEADVSKMVRIALIEAGADEATIDDFELNIKLDDKNTFISSKGVENLQNMIKEETGVWESNLSEIGGGLGDAVMLNWSDQDNLRTSDNAHFKASYTQAAHKLFTDASEAIAAASDEIKPEVAATFMDALEVPEGATQEVVERFDRVRAEYAILISRLSADFAELGEITDVDWTKAEGAGAIFASPTLGNSILAGDNHLETAEDATAQYNQIIKELTDANYKLDPSQKLVISNQVRQAAGMNKLGDWALTAEHKIGVFNGTVADMPGPPKTLFEHVTEMNTLGRASEAEAKRVDAFRAALLGLPDSFSKRWHVGVSIDMTTPDEAGKALADMQRAGAEKANAWGLDFAAKQMEQQHTDAIDGIRAAGDRNLKALEGQQKAAEKAAKDREKALDDKHKAQTKALDNQIKEENKQFDKQQKADKKQFDKQQKEDKKLFDKDIDRQKKEFDDAWKRREETVETYYESSRKYLEDQQEAEDKLDKARERHAEAERKRQEMLNDLANKNVDINVAIAGGDLDEAARISNEAAKATEDYYANAGQDISDAESEDKKAARDVRLSGISDSQEASSQFLSRSRETSMEGFNLGIEGQQEAFGEKQEGEQETFADKLEKEKEEFQLQLDARKEQLQLQQEQEKEYLALQREAEAEYFANKKEQIQSVTDATIQGAEDAHAKRKENMENELALLKINSGATEEEINRTTKEILETYSKYGVDLGEEADKLYDGMIDHLHAGIDQAAAEMREDEAWIEVGVKIGEMIEAGMDIGMDLTPGEALRLSTSGKMPKELGERIDLNRANRAHQSYSQSNSPPGPDPKYKGLDRIPRRATGGAISGPGSGTSDSILARLSNGEHVLTAQEVRALGGHAAVERFRRQAANGNIPGFAKGGAAGGRSSMSSDAGLTVNISPTGIGGSGDGGVLSAVAADVQSIGSQFDDSLAGTAAPAWRLFGSSLIAVKRDSIDPTFDAMQTAMANAQEQTINTTAGVMSPAWFKFGQNLDFMKSQIWDFTMESMQSGLTSLADGTTDAIADKMIPAWTDGANHISDMQRRIIDPTMQATRDATTETAQNFGTAADMIGVGWDKVKENTAVPVRYTIDTVFNKGLVGMWNEVADKLDLKTLDEFPLQFADGGVMPGYTPGRDVHKFTSPTGGALHLSGGEAIMRPEWTRAVGGPRAVAQMNSDAKRGKGAQKFADGGVVSGDFEPDKDYTRRYQTHADHYEDGGVFEVNQSGGNRLPQTPLSTPINRRLWDIVRTVAPGLSLTSTEVWRPSGAQRDPHHGTGHAIDVSDGGAQTPTAATTGLARFFYETYGPALTELIHYPLNGWQNIKNGAPLNYDSWTNSGHMNHVHIAAHSVLPDPGGALPTFISDGGVAGGGMMSAMAMEIINTWNTKRTELENQIKGWTSDATSGIANDIPMAMFEKMADGMHGEFSSSLPTTLAGGGAPIDWNGLPADIKSNIELGKYAAEQVGWTGAEWEALKTLWHNESGWDNNAKNPTSTAYGIAQFLDQTWAGFGPKTADPKKQIEYGIQYIKGRQDYGGPVNGTPSRALAAWQSRSPHWYDEGGIANGRGAMMKNTLEPERVLSPEQTRSFGSLVDVLDRAFGSSVVKDTVSRPLGDADYTRKITDLDKSLYSGKMSDKEYNPKSQEDMANMLQPIFNAFQAFIQREVVPGVVKYATDLIQMKTDEERLEKVSSDIISGIENVYIPSNNEVNMVFGGTVYGDGHLVQIMEDYKRQILSEVRAISEEAARRVSGK